MDELLTPIERREYLARHDDSDCRTLLGFLMGAWPDRFDELAAFAGDVMYRHWAEADALAALDRVARVRATAEQSSPSQGGTA